MKNEIKYTMVKNIHFKQWPLGQNYILFAITQQK